jgi:hypothetical protein
VHSPDLVKELSSSISTAAGLEPTDDTTCGGCSHSAAEHSAEHGGCTNGSIGDLWGTRPSRLASTYLPHDDEVGSIGMLAEALESAGLTDSHPDHRAIVSAIGNLAATGGKSEARRRVHAAMHDTIMRLGSTGVMPKDVTSDTPEGIPHRRLDNANIIKSMADAHHGGDINTMVDSFRKWAGYGPEVYGLTDDDIGETYKQTQNVANEAAAAAVQQNTFTRRNPELTADECESCTRSAQTIQDALGEYFTSMSAVPDGEKKAYDGWDSLISTIESGGEMPKDSHKYLLMAEGVIKDWRDSGHLTGEAHKIPGSGYFSKIPARLAKRAFGSGNVWPAHLDALYHRVVYGRGAGRVTIQRKKDKTLQDLWSYLTDGGEASDGWLSSPENMKKFSDLENHLRSTGSSHIADKLINRSPISIRNENGEMEETGRNRITLNTGSQLISFIAGRDDEKSRWVTNGTIMRKPLPDQTVDVVPYAETPPVYSDLEDYIFQRGLGVNIKKLKKQKVSDEMRSRLPCSGKMVRDEEADTIDPFTGERTEAYTAKALLPSLIPEGTGKGKHKRLEQRECNIHADHEHNPSTGEIISVSTPAHEFKAEDKAAGARLFEKALKAINPVRYQQDRERFLTRLGADHKRFIKGEIDLAGNFIGDGEDTEPYDSDVGTDVVDVFGNTMQRLRDLGAMPKQREQKPQTKRTRKK